MYNVISRADAIDQGLATYFTGKPCLNGHISHRKVGNGVCVECDQQRTRRWRKEGKKQEMCKAKEMPSLDYLAACFYIKDGVLYWAVRPEHHFNSPMSYGKHLASFANKPAGHVNKRHGYIEVRLDGKIYKAHRIIYKMVYGVEPEHMVDHKDGDVSNNSPENLREATSIENARNAKKRTKCGTSNYKGVVNKKGKWHSVVTVNDVAVPIEAASEEDAARDYDRRARELFGEFAKLNFEQH